MQADAFTQATLWVESSPGAEDFQPLAINHGSGSAAFGGSCGLFRKRIPQKKPRTEALQCSMAHSADTRLDPDRSGFLVSSNVNSTV